MQKVKKIIGNIFQDETLAQEFATNDPSCKTILMSRHELEKTRQKQKSTDGTSIGISLDEQKKIRHGDVIEGDDLHVLVKQLPEMIVTINLSTLAPKFLVTMGHMIGNLHKPISVSEDTVSIPVRSDIEVDLIRTMFRDFVDPTLIVLQEKIFEPNKSMDVHEH